MWRLEYPKKLWKRPKAVEAVAQGGPRRPGTNVVRHFTGESESSDEDTDSREKEEKRNGELMSRFQDAECESRVVKSESEEEEDERDKSF
eukprot:6508813-Karenia_brevis.AAC.1